MPGAQVRELARARWRIALVLGASVFALYFGFIFAVAFARELMAIEIVPGLSVGILSGALVIVGAWLSTWLYVRWANAHFDARLQEIGDSSLISGSRDRVGDDRPRNE
jgi:uncharacterized membrane protein (DUF485 family)